MKTKSWLLTMALCASMSAGAQARYYDPGVGRFITPDTVVQDSYDPQSLNRYTYVRNNPINLIDPLGYSWLSKEWRRNGASEWWNKNRYYAITSCMVIATGGMALAGVGTNFAVMGTTLNGILSAATVGQIGGAVAGGMAAKAAGGDVGKGVFFGAAVGGVTAGISQGVLPGEVVNGMSGMKLVGARMAEGAIYGTGFGASYGYAGGTGNTNAVLQGMGRGALYGAATGAVLGGAEWYAKSNAINYANFEVRGKPYYEGGYVRPIVRTFQFSSQPLNAALSIPLFHALTVNAVYNAFGAAETAYFSDENLRDSARQQAEKEYQNKLEDGVHKEWTW